MVQELSIEFVPEDRANDPPLQTTIAEAQAMWILPLETRNIKHPILTEIWAVTIYNQVAIRCVFHDVYDSKPKPKINNTWVVNRAKRTMILQ